MIDTRSETQTRIAALQRELIDLLRGDVEHTRAQLALAALNGDIEGRAITHGVPTEKWERIRALRVQLLQLDSQACVFQSWGGPMPVGHGARSADFGDLSNGPERAAA
jgi:hypothetical protein